MLPSNQLPNSESTGEATWNWLKSRLERSELLEAAHGLDEWIADDLHKLESGFANWITEESSKLADGLLVQSTRRS